MSVEEFRSFDTTAFVEDLDRSIKNGEFNSQRQRPYEAEIICEENNQKHYYEVAFLRGFFIKTPADPVDIEAPRLLERFKHWKNKEYQRVNAYLKEILDEITLVSLAEQASAQLKMAKEPIGFLPGSGEAQLMIEDSDYWFKVEEITLAAVQIEKDSMA